MHEPEATYNIPTFSCHTNRVHCGWGWGSLGTQPDQCPENAANFRLEVRPPPALGFQFGSAQLRPHLVGTWPGSLKTLTSV